MQLLRPVLASTLVGLLLLADALPAAPAEPRAKAPLILGVLDFPTSGSQEAQAAFERGVMFMHSFEYSEARREFLEAQASDPTFAMAIWGEAMTHNHPVWHQQNRDAALTALSKLPPKASRSTTPVEERFIAAVQVLYGDGSKETRDLAYRDAMAEMYEDYPDNLEVATFYALSLLGSVRERDYRTYMQAAAIAEEVFAKQPKHPGAAHYIIHSYDDPVHAPLGLRAARVYAGIAPSASHAQHMVSHIYSSLGRWHDAVEPNRVSVRVSEDALLRNGRSRHMRSKHSLYWLEYALLQEGRVNEALETTNMMREDLVALPDQQNLTHSAMMRATFVVAAPQEESGLVPLDNNASVPVYYRVLDDFSSAWLLITAKKLSAARAIHDRMQKRIGDAKVRSVDEGLHECGMVTTADENLVMRVLARQLEALLLFNEGEGEQALALLAQAIEDEASRQPYIGPPDIPKPSTELAGEMLLAMNRAGEAMSMFKQALDRHTNRTYSLLGLARAKAATGNENGAKETWALIDTQWRGERNALRSAPYAWLQLPR